jgi:nicotinate phosphoribosyltransferase
VNIEPLLDRYNTLANKIRDGYFTAQYFNDTKDILEADKDDTTVVMQVFQKKDAIIAGIPEVLKIFEVGAGEWVDGEWVSRFDELEIRCLKDGDTASPREPVMHIVGTYRYFAHLESLYLGILARRTKVATNMHRCVQAAGEKPVMFFADRFDDFINQEGDGYAAQVGGAKKLATKAMTLTGGSASGTMPHSLIAVSGGDIALATARMTGLGPPSVALVDFNNDCVNDAVKAVRDSPRGYVSAVRLDTSENMIDKSLRWRKGIPFLGRGINGVNPALVRKVRIALNLRVPGGFGDRVKIYVSGGFTPEKIARFEKKKAPVDGYGVGSGILNVESYDFTADIVFPAAKVGRRMTANPRLTLRGGYL